MATRNDRNAGDRALESNLEAMAILDTMERQVVGILRLFRGLLGSVRLQRETLKLGNLYAEQASRLLDGRAVPA